MVDAKKLGPTGCRYMGTPYEKMDCQAFWERVLKDCGIKMDLGGSNSWYRYMMKHGWCGTPAECVKTFGGIPVGATLYIRKDVSDKTPAQFRDDGIGDITHMGIFTGMTGKEMVQIALDAGVSHADKYNYGDGAINSSSSRGGVCTSKFAGKSISGGWNRIGLWLDSIVYDGTTPPEPGPEPKPEPTTAMVYAENDFPVKMREKPSTSCKLYDPVPCGSIVEVLAKDCSTDNAGNVWSQISYGSREGWYMMSKFLLFAGESCIVIIPNLSMEQAEELVKQYPGAYIEMAKG
jgi:hypothetical protein